MNLLKIIVSVFFLFGCNSPTSSVKPKSFDSNIRELFFNADIGSKYENLVNYFKKVNGLKEVETGWTIYPPLSALGEAENKTEQETFEFLRYLELSSGFKDGILVVREIGPYQDALAVLEISLGFKSKNDAEVFYTKVVAGFEDLQLGKKEMSLENFRTIVFDDNATGSIFVISEFSDKVDKLYHVTLRHVPGE